MGYKIKYFLIAIVLALGCGRTDNQINLSFNPSQAIDLNKIPVKVKVDDQIILDTLIENRHVDKSLFIKRFNYQPNKNALLHVEINGKKKNIKGMYGLPKCTDIFLDYDDHSLIFKEIKGIEILRADQHMPADFKQLFDSIKASSGNKYHNITFSIREGECYDL